MALDFAKLGEIERAQEDGACVILPHPVTGDDIGVKAWVASHDSERVMARARAIAEGRRKAGGEVTVQDQHEIVNDIVIASVTRWEGVEDGGKPVECTADNVRSVLRVIRPWHDVILEAGTNRALFIDASLTASPRPSKRGSNTTRQGRTGSPSGSTLSEPE